MKHSVHCEQTADVHSLLDQHFPLGRTLAQPRGSPAGLCPAMDWSTHTFVQRRLLAQKLLERSHASKALMDALEGPRANRDAALVILLHCCKLNNTLSQSCTKAGLIRRLFHLVNSPDMTPIAKVCDPTLLLLPSCTILHDWGMCGFPMRWEASDAAVAEGLYQLDAPSAARRQCSQPCHMCRHDA